MAKIELSDRLRFSAGRILARETDSTLNITGQKTAIKRGDRLRAKLEVAGIDGPQQVHAVRLEVSGQTEGDDDSSVLRLRSEILQSSQIPDGYLLSIPVLFQSPENAVFTQHGADWTLRAALIEPGGGRLKTSLSFRIIP